LREDIYVFPLKFAFSVLGWRAINFCANLAKIGLLCEDPLVAHVHVPVTTSLLRPFAIFSGSRKMTVTVKVFLKQNREKLFVATTKHLCATFGQFFADFQWIFQLNLRAILAHFHANFAFSPRFSSGTDKR